MSLAWNTKQLLAGGARTADQTAIEYHFLTWREFYDKSIISADRYSSGAAEWVLRGDRHFYTLTVTTRPYYRLPQELCLFFDCFTETREFAKGTSVGPPFHEVAYEFAALLSVLTREAILPIGPRRIGDHPVSDRYHFTAPERARPSCPPPPAAIDPLEIASILKGIAGAPDETTNAAIAAMKSYHTALSLVGFDPPGAYVSLVSTIERLAGYHYKSRKFEFDSVRKFDGIRPILENIAKQVSNDAEIKKLKDELIRRESFVYQKFKLLIIDYLPDEFWTIPDELNLLMQSLPAIKQENLASCLRRIYDARSGYVHEGRPFPAYIELGLHDSVPVAALMESLGIIGKANYLPPFSWFERVTNLVLREYLHHSFAPELVQARKVTSVEKQRLIEIIRGLPEKARDSLKRLTTWTAQFLNYSVFNPLAPNKIWADSTDTIKILLETGLIGCDGETLEARSWLKDREVGEAIGEYFFSSEENPFRGNELLLPKNWGDASADYDVPDESVDD